MSVSLLWCVEYLQTTLWLRHEWRKTNNWKRRYGYDINDVKQTTENDVMVTTLMT